MIVYIVERWEADIDEGAWKIHLVTLKLEETLKFENDADHWVTAWEV